jgi:lactate permease
VAITSVMLIALGFKPVKAAVVALVANTAPVAFGALACRSPPSPRSTGLPEQQLSSIVGRQTPLPRALRPDGPGLHHRQGARRPRDTPGDADLWHHLRHRPVRVLQLRVPQLTDIVASLVAAASVVLLLRVWRPAAPYVEAPRATSECVGHVR